MDPLSAWKEFENEKTSLSRKLEVGEAILNWHKNNGFMPNEICLPMIQEWVEWRKLPHGFNDYEHETEWQEGLFWIKVKYLVSYKVNGKYIPQSYYEPAEYPEIEWLEPIVDSISISYDQPKPNDEMVFIGKDLFSQMSLAIKNTFRVEHFDEDKINDDIYHYEDGKEQDYNEPDRSDFD